MRLVILAVIASVGIARAEPAMLGGTPREQAMKLYDQATKMFEDQDFIAAAVTFGQAAQLLSRVDRDPGGAVIDKEAHSYRNAALSNRATAYSRASLYPEAYAAFVELRDQFGAELADKDRAEITDAIEEMDKRIGTVVLRALPAEDVEVRLDGRLERRPLDKPLRMGEGTHALEVAAKGYKPYTAELSVLGQQELVHEVKLVSLDTPAKLRVEANAGSTTVAIDGIERGDAPVEVTLRPGMHHVTVKSIAYLDQTSDVELRPGERSILHVGMIYAHAPLGLRVMPEFLATFPQRTDTPFGVYNNTLALALFHDALRVHSVRFGIEVDYTPRVISSVATGVIGMWCPDRLTWAAWTVCPVTLIASYQFGGEEGLFGSGFARGRGASTIEWRRGMGFVRGGLGLMVEDYERLPNYHLMLWSTVAELAIGVDL